MERAGISCSGAVSTVRRWQSIGHGKRGILSCPIGTYVNLMVTMLLCGLWHGASWNFVFWGGLHGAALAIHRAWKAWDPLVSDRNLREPDGDDALVRPLAWSELEFRVLGRSPRCGAGNPSGMESVGSSRVRSE